MMCFKQISDLYTLDLNVNPNISIRYNVDSCPTTCCRSCNATMQVLESQPAGLAGDVLWKTCLVGPCRHLMKDKQIKAVCCTVHSIGKEQLTRTTVGEENLFQ